MMNYLDWMVTWSEAMRSIPGSGLYHVSNSTAKEFFIPPYLSIDQII